MTPARLTRGASIALMSALLGALVVACDLNPQPLPPGDVADSGNGNGAQGGGTTNGAGGSGDAATVPAAPADASFIADGALTDAPSGSADGGPDAPGDGALDGGDAGDAGD